MTEATPNDGVVTLPILSTEDLEMSQGIDLPPSVAQAMLAESSGNIQAANAQGRNTFVLASGALQAGISKTHNELGPVESRAVSGVMATPVAGPATQGSNER
ncbi:MAG: hypothetical protein AAF394_00065 [Planctomycetota bacterium]